MKKEQPKEINGRQASQIIHEQLESGLWESDYQFRSSDNFFLRKLEVKTKAPLKQVWVSFVVEYKTKSHRVINNVCWKYPYNLVGTLHNHMEKLENDIMLKTGDKDQVFGERFNKVLFAEKKYEEKGWIVKK